MAQQGGTLKGILIGGAIGAVAALLLAPKSGKEMREDIRLRYTDVQDRTKQLVSDVSSRTSDVAKQVSQQATQIMDKTRSAVTAAKDEVQSWREEKQAEATGTNSTEQKFN